jgi:peptidyl-prolyl cis-trans isomerase D
MGSAIIAQGRIATLMLSFFRKFAKSPIGLAVFGLIIVAFVVTLYEGKSMFGGGAGDTGGAIAKVGNTTIGEAEAIRRTQNALEGARQEKPELDLNAFVAQGGADQTIDQMINGRAFQQFAAMNGLVASRRLVDGQIASIPAFNGPNGQFDRTTYLAILDQRRIPESQLRDDFAREAVTKMLLGPVAGGARPPLGLVTPYASLLLEVRQGQVATVPSASFASNTPLSDADLKTYFQRNVARYTVPERRVVKLARFDRSRFDGKVVPSDAEVAAAYKAAAAKYAGRETRSFTQIIVPKQSDADALLTKVRGGTSMADAAKGLGLEALAVATTDKLAFEKLTGAKVAEAAFAAPKSGFAAVSQSGLGYHIVRVDNVTAVAARPLEAVRGELVAELSKTKIDEAMADLVAKVEDEINAGATFDDVAKKFAITADTTPAITASGVAPDAPDYKFSADYQPLLRDVFQSETGEEPQVASVGNGTAYVIYHMDRVIAAAPKPLADIRNQVMADAQIERASLAAKRVADAVAAAVNKGTAFTQALAGSGAKLPAPRTAGARRIDLVQMREQVPPPLATMFGMAEKRAKVISAPEGAGWFVVYLDKITQGDPKAAAPLIAATQQQLTQVIGDEYVQQFANAVKAKVGVTRNGGALAAFKKSMTGGAAR